jgi:glyoxylase-like metal-dependent hydrolase (beta-lactamase superfamily II)
MKSTAITAYSTQLTRFGFVNCFLVREPDGFTLVDTGVPGSADDILAAALTLGAPVLRILLTHAHMDHVGSVDALVERLGRSHVELLSNARNLSLLRQPPDTTTHTGEPKDKIKGGVPGIKSVPTHLVAEGDLVGSLRVIDTPGHIPGHMSFLDERDGTLYAGDALVAVGHLSVCGWTPWYFPSNPFTWHKPTALASAKKLLAYPIERFACGHGDLKSGSIPTLRAAIAKAVS